VDTGSLEEALTEPGRTFDLVVSNPNGGKEVCQTTHPDAHLSCAVTFLVIAAESLQQHEVLVNDGEQRQE
jgi:hypothetical protein